MDVRKKMKKKPLVLFALITALIFFVGCGISAEAQARLDVLAVKEIELSNNLVELYHTLSVAVSEGESDVTITQIKEAITNQIAEQKAVWAEVAEIKSTENAATWAIIGGAVVGVLRGLPSKGPLKWAFSLLAGLISGFMDDKKKKGKKK